MSEPSLVSDRKIGLLGCSAPLVAVGLLAILGTIFAFVHF
jgi:hypothetical protein